MDKEKLLAKHLVCAQRTFRLDDVKLTEGEIYRTKKSVPLNVERIFYCSRPKDGIIEPYPHRFSYCGNLS